MKDLLKDLLIPRLGRDQCLPTIKGNKSLNEGGLEQEVSVSKAIQTN